MHQTGSRENPIFGMHRLFSWRRLAEATHGWGCDSISSCDSTTIEYSGPTGRNPARLAFSGSTASLERSSMRGSGPTRCSDPQPLTATRSLRTRLLAASLLNHLGWACELGPLSSIVFPSGSLR